MSIFRSIWSRIGGGWRHASKPEDELIDYFVTTVEPELKRVKGYRKRLREPLRICRGHCKSLVAEIPGPIIVRRTEHCDDPFIRAAFTGSNRIEDLFDHANGTISQAKLSGTRRFALLTMTSREKTIFGRKQLGDMMVGDAAMRTVDFNDHNIVGLATTLASSREALEKYTLEIIAEAAAQELSAIRTKLVDLRQRQEWLRTMNKMFGTGTSVNMGCVFVPFDPEKQKKQQEIEQLMVENEDEIASARSESEAPENWLTIVENFLSKPEDILNMRLISLRLNWSNVLTDDPKEKADTITFATFTLADEMQREGVLIVYE
ncbi:MAG: hypothetical protein HKP41_15015 [Desulfobacterales bacterium]|nr:hypothetical protein [Desulfobacterales bacterium]